MRELERQAEAFQADLGLSRAQTVLELLGRKHLDGTEEDDPLRALATERILDVLLGIEDAGELVSLVEQACSPQPPRQELGEDEEALSTTPMQLLQAANARLAALQTQRCDSAGEDDEQASQGDAGGRDDRLTAQAAVLVRVREACAQLWADETMPEVQRARD